MIQYDPSMLYFSSSLDLFTITDILSPPNFSFLNYLFSCSLPPFSIYSPLPGGGCFLRHTQLNHMQLGLPAKRASVRAGCLSRSHQSADSVDKSANITGWWSCAGVAAAMADNLWLRELELVEEPKGLLLNHRCSFFLKNINESVITTHNYRPSPKIMS